VSTTNLNSTFPFAFPFFLPPFPFSTL
jgi:hypothetical protein